MPPSLVLGPLLRYVGETEAVVWVETDAACDVDVLGTRERTLQVDGHNYALITAKGLDPGTCVAVTGPPQKDTQASCGPGASRQPRSIRRR